MEHDVKCQDVKEAVETAIMDLDIKKEEYAKVRTSEKKKTKGNT